jgi:iron complex outermembrane receptor protein
MVYVKTNNGILHNPRTFNHTPFSQAKLNFQTTYDSDLMVLFRQFYSPISQDPGTLTSAEVHANPRQASARNVQFNAGEEITQEDMGVRFRKRPSAGQELTVTAHMLHRDFQNRLAFFDGGQVQFDRWVGGLMVQFVNDHILFNRPNRFLAGVDYGVQNDDRQRFNNNFGVRGALNLSQIERVQSAGPFFRNEWNMADKLDLVIGGRWDWLNYYLNPASPKNQTASSVFYSWMHDSMPADAVLVCGFRIF